MMSPSLSSSTDLLQEIQSNLRDAEKTLRNHIQSLLSRFKKHDELYSNAFVKHIGDDSQLRGKYELMCDLRKSAMDEHVSEVLGAVNTQSDTIRHCITQLNDIISNSSSSVESDVSIKVEKDKSEMSINQSQNTIICHKDDVAINQPSSVSTTQLISDKKTNGNTTAVTPAVVESDIVPQSGMSINTLYASESAPSCETQTGSISKPLSPISQPRGPPASVDARPSKRRRISVERDSRDDGRRERWPSDESGHRTERVKEERYGYRARGPDPQDLYESDHLRSNNGALTRWGRGHTVQPKKAKKPSGNPQKIKYEKHRAEMRLMAERNRSFSLSQFDEVYMVHFKESIRKSYKGKLKLLVSHFTEYFQIQEIKSRNVVLSLLYESNVSKRRRDDIDSSIILKASRRHRVLRWEDLRKSTYGPPPRLRRECSRSPPLSKTGETYRNDGNGSVELNISGVWAYSADHHFRLILEEDLLSRHFIGIMVLNNETQCSIEGNRKLDKSYYRLCKIFPSGQRTHYSIYFGSKGDTLHIIKDGDTRSKTVVLETREIPMPFQKQLVCNLCFVLLQPVIDCVEI